MRRLSSAAIDPSVAAPACLLLLLLLFILLLLSFASIILILSLHFRSRSRLHLSAFTPLLPLRFALTCLVLFWTVHSFTVIRPAFPYAIFCKLHVILSLGLLQPAFLITILFLLHLSIQKSPLKGACRSIFLSLLPVLALQIFSVVFLSPPPFKKHLPSLFVYESALKRNNNDSYECTTPFFSAVAFAFFAVVYNVGFLFTYWRVIRLVINKGTRIRIHILAFTLLICISLQVLLMLLSAHWGPGIKEHGLIMVGMIATVAACAVVGEVILVIKPISDALSASGWICGGAQAVEGSR